MLVSFIGSNIFFANFLQSENHKLLMGCILAFLLVTYLPQKQGLLPQKQGGD